MESIVKKCELLELNYIKSKQQDEYYDIEATFLSDNGQYNNCIKQKYNKKMYEQVRENLKKINGN